MSNHQHIVRSLALCLVVACGDSQLPAPERPQVALVPATTSNALDLLLVMDDSIDLDVQIHFTEAFPAFLDELETLPDLHVGVVTSDLGTKGYADDAPGPSIGSGPGSCSGEGKAGRLVTSGTQLVQGTFIYDVAGPNGSRTTNYSSTLPDAMRAIASVGASGCGFEQPLEAMRIGLLDTTGYNAGFLRPDARLAIIALQDEDDCSFAHSALIGPDTTTFGPLQSFRCTRFGVTCDVGGRTTDEMNTQGDKQSCHSREDSPYVGPLARYRDVLTTIKPDPRDVSFAVIAGPPEPVVIESRTPPGGGTVIPALGHTCAYQGANGTNVADPAVRMAELTRDVARGHFEQVCALDQEPAVRAIARQIRSLLGDSCLLQPIATPNDCVAVDERVDGSGTALPACDTRITDNCYELVADETCHASGLRVVPHRASAPDGTMLSLRCTLP